MLGTTTAAVKSTLQRARARLRKWRRRPIRSPNRATPQARALLDHYIAAFENADAGALARLLRQDATLELPPSPAWFAGRDAAAGAVAGLGAPGDWRMLPATANGQPGRGRLSARQRRRPPGVRDRRAHRGRLPASPGSSCSPTPACSPDSTSRPSTRTRQPLAPSNRPSAGPRTLAAARSSQQP